MKDRIIISVHSIVVRGHDRSHMFQCIANANGCSHVAAVDIVIGFFSIEIQECRVYFVALWLLLGGIKKSAVRYFFQRFHFALNFGLSVESKLHSTHNCERISHVFKQNVRVTHRCAIGA